MSNFKPFEFEEQDCITCFVKFMVPTGFTKARQNDKKTFYCPNGHSMSYTQSEADRLRSELLLQNQATQRAKEEAERERRWRQEACEEARTLERRLSAQRGVTTRLKNRVSKGVCPCCNRHFTNLERHMATKHAGFLIEEVQSAEGQTVQ